MSVTKERVRFAQPTHHIPLLWLSEAGIVGALWVISLVVVIWPHLKNLEPWWLMLIPIAGLDHYLLTTEAGLLLVLLLLSGVLFSKLR